MRERESVTVTEKGTQAPSVHVQMLGRYRVDGPLGEGGMGAVFVGYDPELDRRAAVKVLRNAMQTNHARARLLREARALALLAHPNIVVVYEVGSHANRDFIAMELIEGGTLADWLTKPRSVDDILEAFLAAGRGLAHAHAHDLVHRDFKPRNVLRASSGRIVVTDFGLVRSGQSSPGEPIDESMPFLARGSQPRLTQTGAVLGTPAYMAPEQWNGAAITPSTDQFSFCVSLWEALVGARPYDDRAAAERGPRELDASRLPRALRPILLRGLEPIPALRWPSMTAVLAQLARVRRGRRRTLLPVAAGLVVAVGGIGGMLAVQPTSAAQRCRDAAARRNELVRQYAGARAGELSVDPGACAGSEPPRLGLRSSQQTRDALGLYAGVAHDRDARAAFVFADAPEREPCARLIALSAALMTTHDVDRAIEHRDPLSAAIEACDDDHLRAFATLGFAHLEMSNLVLGVDARARLEHVDAALQHVAQADLLAERDVLEAAVLAHERRFDRGIALLDHAIEQLGALHREEMELDARSLRAMLRMQQGTTAGIALARDEIIAVRPRLAALGEELADADRGLGILQLLLGDLAAAHRTLEGIPRARRKVAKEISGRVVDRTGRPVEGARVYAAGMLWADSIGPLPLDPDDFSVTTTGADGTFVMSDGPVFGAVIAVHAGQRSRAFGLGEKLDLALAPTRTVSGRIPAEALATHAAVVAFTPQQVSAYHVLAPVADDGTFATDAAPSEDAEAVAMFSYGSEHELMTPSTPVPAGPRVDRFALRLPAAGRSVHVAVRNEFDTQLSAAEVLLVPGDASALTRNRALTVPPLESRLATRGRTSDLEAALGDVPDEPLSVCAIALPATYWTGTYRTGDLAMRCVRLAPTVDAVTIDVAPQRRQ